MAKVSQSPPLFSCQQVFLGILLMMIETKAAAVETTVAGEDALQVHSQTVAVLKVENRDFAGNGSLLSLCLKQDLKSFFQHVYTQALDALYPADVKERNGPDIGSIVLVIDKFDGLIAYAEQTTESAYQVNLSSAFMASFSEKYFPCISHIE